MDSALFSFFMYFTYTRWIWPLTGFLFCKICTFCSVKKPYPSIKSILTFVGSECLLEVPHSKDTLWNISVCFTCHLLNFFQTNSSFIAQCLESYLSAHWCKYLELKKKLLWLRNIMPKKCYWKTFKSSSTEKTIPDILSLFLSFCFFQNENKQLICLEISL